MDRSSVLSISSNNPMSPNCLKIVKASPEDRDVRVISSRMGMSVAEFMDVLGCTSSATERSNCDSGGFVWPKHTELEVRDPWSGVYQYEPSDVSWCIRFKALGCYNYVPPPFTDRSYKVPTTPQLVPDNKEVIKNDQASPNSAGFQTLLKMRPPAEKSEVLPPETITPAERHKLWEDLLLSDSDEDNNEKSRSPTAVKTTIFETPAVNEELLEKANSMCAATKLELLNHALRPPPPFVSPLSIINDEGSGTESLAPSPHNDQVLCSQINQQERFNDSRNVPEVHNEPSVNKSSLAASISSPRESEIFNAENISCKRLSATVVSSDKLPTSAQTTVVSDITNIPSKLPTTASTIPPKTISPTMPKPVTVSSDKSTKSEVVHKPSHDMITSTGKELYSQHCKTPEARKSFIQRLLLESKEFLSQKDSLFVELSPIHNKHQQNVVSSPKILPHSESGRTAFIEQKSAEKAFDATDTSKTPLNHMNVTSNSYKSSLQEGVQQLDSVVGQCKITSQQLSSHHHDKRKDSVEVNDITNPKLSKLNSSSSVSQGTPKPSPVKSDSRPSSLSKLTNDELLRAVNLNLGLHKPDIESEKLDKLEVDEINESKTSVSGIQTPVTNPDSCHSNASSVNNMPPPTHDSTGKKLKKRSRFSTELTSDTICQSPAISEPSQENVDDKEGEEGDSTFVAESNQDTAGIYPLRDIPSDCWVFSDLTVTKVRNAIQQSFPHHVLNSSGTTKDSDDAPTDLTSSEDLIKKMRDILRSAIESDSPINSKAISNRRNRPRSLTGILLVPPSGSPSPSSPKTKLSLHESIDIPQKSYCEIFTMTSPYCHPTIPSADADIQCDIWPSNSSSSSSNNLSTRFASQCSSGIVSTPTQKPLGTVPPILRDPTSDLTTLSSSTTQSLPHSTPSVNLVDSLCFIEEQFGRIMKQEDEKLQNSNASTEIFKAEECKFEASRCWKSLVSAISSTSRGNNSSESSNRSQMLLTLQALHEYPVQMTKSVRHYLAAAHIFESKNETNRAIGMLTEATEQIQHCVRRMHRVEAKLTKRRNHRNESGNSPDNNNNNNNNSMNDLALKVKRDASWMYLWYYVLMRIKAVVGFHIYRLRLQSIESLHEEIDASISAVQHTIPSLKEIINIPKSLDSPSSSSLSKPASSKSQIPSNPSSESDSKKVLESLVGQFVRLNQLTACVRSAMVEWQQANELATKVPHLKSSALIIPSTGRKPDGSSADNPSSSSSSSSGHHLRLTHSIDIDIANASDGAHINTSQIPLLILLRYMDGIFHVHSQIIDQLKCPNDRQETGQSNIISTKYNSSNELRNSSIVSQEQKIITCLSTMANNPITSSSSSSLGGATTQSLSTVTTTKLSNKEESTHSKVVTSSTSSTVFSTGSNMIFQTETTPPTTTITTTNNVVKEQSSKKKSHRKHSDITTLPNAMTSSATKLSPYQNSNPLDDNCSDTSAPSSKHEKPSSVPKHKSKRRRLVQLDTSVNTSSSDNSDDTDMENCETAAAVAAAPPPSVVNNKYKQSPVKKRHKSRLLETDTEQEFINHRKKIDRIDTSSSQENRHSLSIKKSSKRSHMPSGQQQHSNLQGRDGNSHSENRIIASDDDQSPNASPPPSRKFCRSKSLAPITSRSSSPKCHVNSVTSVQSSQYPVVPREDNTYEPKRIKSTSTKVHHHHHRRIPNSESSDDSRSSSSPTPTYRPSIPLNSPDSNNNDISRRRRSRSVHLSSSSKHKNASPMKTPKTPQDELSHDSIGYSPTKGSFLNGISSDTNNLPVYYVSQIPSSPPPPQQQQQPPSKSQHSNRSVTNTNISSSHNNNNNSHNDLYRSKSSHRSEVPSFYARWIKEPSNNNAADHHRFSSSSINSSNGNSGNNVRRHRSQW